MASGPTAELELLAARQRAEREVERLVVLYGIADAELRRIVAEAGETRSIARLIRRARGVLKRVREQVTPRSEGLLLRAYANGARLADLDLDPDERVHRAVLDVLIDDTTGRLDDRLATVGRDVEVKLRRQISIHAQAALLERGDARHSIESRLTDALRDEGIVGFRDRRGREWSLEAYARMALRTKLAEAQFEGTRTAMLATGLDTFRISSHGCDHHPKNPLHPCRRFEGERFSLTGKGGARVLPVPFPFHPNCTHYAIPDDGPVPGLEAI